MKRRFSLFTYPVMDIKAAEGALNRKAAEGWRLERLWLGLLASFVPAEGPVRYCIDWIDPALRPDRPSYAALLAEAGWRRRALLDSWAIYEGPADALPIQTDSALEYRRFRRKVLRRMAIGGAVAAVILLLLLGLLLAGSGGRFAWRDWAGVLSLSSLSGGLLLSLPLLLAGGVLWLGRMALRLWQWKRAAEAGEPFPVPGRVSAGAARLCVLLGWVWGLLILAALALDILDGKANTGWAVGLAGAGFLAGKLYPDMDEELRRRQRRLAWGAVALAAAVLLVPLLTPDGLTDPLYPRRPMENVRLLAERCHASAALKTSDELLASLRAGGIPSVVLGKFSDKYTVPEQIKHNLENGYLVEHTYDGNGASGRTIYVNQFPLYFESQGVVNSYEPCHSLNQDGDAIRKEFEQKD